MTSTFIPSLQNASNSLSHHINLQQIQSQLPFPIKKEHQTFTLRPPWLPPQTQQPSLFQDFQENPQNHHNPNPNPNTPMGPTPFHPHYLPPPHISATALLQNATEMGSKSSGAHHAAGEETPTTAGFGLKLASRDHHQFINGLAPFCNNKAAPLSSPPPPNSMLHEMMMISASGFDHQE